LKGNRLAQENAVRRAGKTLRPDRSDTILALVVAACALVAYVRTLAPDVLYGDSAEFQTLTYTLGTTHTTGYPIYLLLARGLGLLPAGTLAWRVNLLSGVGAAVTLGCVYLLLRYLTPSRTGALLSAAALGLSYTFWSQSVIAEVYTPGLAFLAVIALLLWHWYCHPTGHDLPLGVAAFLAGAGLGVHASVGLIAPAAVLFVLWALWSRRERNVQWRRGLIVGAVGLIAGLGVYVLAFILIDLHNPPSSFIQVTMLPSRSIWGLSSSDLNTPIKRFIVTVSGLQWQGAMFPEGHSFWEALGEYVDRLVSYEFSPLLILAALLGLEVMLRTTPVLGLFVVGAGVTMLFLVLNYEPPDKYIFFLPTYVVATLAMGSGMGSLLDLTGRRLTRRKPWLFLIHGMFVLVFVWVVVHPYWESRREALSAGAATFVSEDYVYPVDNLEEPRRSATWQIQVLPDQAVLISDWRRLYAMYYLAHAERARPDILIYEAAPYGSGGQVAETLIEELQLALIDGRPVFADRIYSNLRRQFRVQPALGGAWYRLSLLGADPG
jgi:hypothetical protein